jgi:hypothetical protein
MARKRKTDCLQFYRVIRAFRGYTQRHKMEPQKQLQQPQISQIYKMNCALRPPFLICVHLRNLWFRSFPAV